MQYIHLLDLFAIIFSSYVYSSMDSYPKLKYMETSCQLLQLQEDISSLIKEREHIDQRIKEKQFEEKQLQRSNLCFLKIVSKIKSSHNYSPEKQGIKPTTPIKPSVKTTSKPDLKFEVQNKDNNFPKNGSSAAPICGESSQLTDELGDITLNAEHKMPMQSKPRNPQVIVGQMPVASILSADVDNSDDEVDDASLLLAEQNMSSPLTKLPQNVSSIFENVQMRPPTALEELEKHRGMIAMSTELSTSTGCTQGPSCSAVKTNLGIEQEGMGDNLSHADALAFVSGPDVMQNAHDPNPNGEQSINAEKNESLQETKQKGMVPVYQIKVMRQKAFKQKWILIVIMLMTKVTFYNMPVVLLQLIMKMERAEAKKLQRNPHKCS